jgi:hypothetical protein
MGIPYSGADMNKPIAIAAALVFGVSSLAFAQTSPSTSPRSAPSHDSATPGSGSSTARQITDADVKSGLEGLGYSQVTDIKRSEAGYTAKAMRGGKQVMLEIDRNGQVAQKQ